MNIIQIVFFLFTILVGKKSFCRPIYSFGYLFTHLLVSGRRSNDRICCFDTSETKLRTQSAVWKCVIGKNSEKKLKKSFQHKKWKCDLWEPFEHWKTCFSFRRSHQQRKESFYLWIPQGRLQCFDNIWTIIYGIQLCLLGILLVPMIAFRINNV